jgi:hypothetical protein
MRARLRYAVIEAFDGASQLQRQGSRLSLGHVTSGRQPVAAASLEAVAVGLFA